MKNFKLEAPWYTFRKKVNALFGQDPEITVGEVYETGDGQTEYAFDLEIRNHKKFLALDSLLPKTVTFGKTTLGIVLYDEENANGVDELIEQYKAIFQGNPIVKDIKDILDFTGTRHAFIRFQPEVIQFPDDNNADYNGNWSGLAQDIAREILKGEYLGIHFCTAPIEDSVG